MAHLSAETLLLPATLSTRSGSVSVRTVSQKPDSEEDNPCMDMTASAVSEVHSFEMGTAETANQASSLEETCPESFTETLGEVVADVCAVSSGSPAGILGDDAGHYLCQKCGENIPYTGLLTLHQCTLFQQPENLEFHEASHLSLTGHLPVMVEYGQEGKQLSTRLRLAKTSNSTEDSRQEFHANSVDAEKVTCPICMQEFALLNQLKGHFRCHIQHQEVFTCSSEDCQFSTEERKLLHTHLRRVHKVTPVPCAHYACQLLFPSTEDMSQHRRTHFPFHCRQCSFVSSNVKLFWQHRKSHMDEAEDPPLTPTRDLSMKGFSKCNKCDFTTVSGKILTQHLLLHSEDGDISQEDQNSQDNRDPAEDGASSASDIPPQGRMESAVMEYSESKDNSSSTSSEEEDAEEHMQRTRKAAKDKKAAPSKAKVPRAARVRQFKGEKPYKCQRCEFTCRDVSYLSKHMLTHSDDKNYMCTECGYITKWKHYLNVHMRKHTGDLRYRCNQCSYRCHRADQLSSHKLRHQGKSLICEVCGFACKRKYELQKHKQAKHLQNYQVPVYQCQYCSYQSKYKQALHNHENCKHTKQKEFRCALCTYRTFSNTSLFLHKRKIHGYVPGDKNWLENYANKELEINSTDMLMNYDLSGTLRLETNLTTPGRDLWQTAKPATIETQNNDYSQVNGASLPGKEQSQLTQIVTAVRSLEGAPRDPMEATTPDFFAQTSSLAVQSNLPDVTLDNVESCSLHLESMDTQGDPSDTSEYLAKEPPSMQLEDMESMSCEESATAYPDLDNRETLVLEESTTVACLHGSEVSNDAHTKDYSRPGKAVDCTTAEQVMGTEEGSIECTMHSLSEEQPSAHETSSLDAHLETDEQITLDIQETWSSVLKPDALLTIDLTVCNVGAPDQNPLSMANEDTFSEVTEEESKSESALKALRKRDKKEADTLVLEGRVQMLVLQSEAQVFKCENCSFITRKERSLSLHSKAGCLARRAALLCKDCGASFKQQRGLNTHIMKKCLVIQKKSKSRPPFCVQQGKCSRTRQSELQLVNVPTKHVCASVASEPHDQNIVASNTVGNGVDDLQEATCNILADLCVSPEVVCEDLSSERLTEVLLRGMPPGHNSVAGEEWTSLPPCPEKYTFQQGKFRCSACSFVCSRISSITCHVQEACKGLEQFRCPLCPEFFRSKRALKAHQTEKHRARESASEERSSIESSKGEEEEEEEDEEEEEAAEVEAEAEVEVELELEEEHVEGSSAEDEGSDTDNGETYPANDLPGTLELEREKRSKRDKGLCLFCPACPFTCYQDRAMQTHKKRGCLKSDEFQCAVCSFSCKSYKALKHHKQLHKKFYSKRPQLRCNQCDFTCKQSRCLKQHIQIRHEGVKPHKCAYCDFSTTRRYRLEAHESLHTGVGRIACDVCNQTFGTNSKLRIHKLRVHEKKPTHFCSLCDYSGYNQNDINRHLKSCHNGQLTFTCTQCEAGFSSETALKQHCLRRHEEKICLNCQHCPFVCHSVATLKYHIQKLHPHLECGTCKELFDNRDELEGHKKSHFTHHCESCDFAAKERPQLVHHYMEAHETDANVERGLHCPFCEFACHHQLVLDHHMKGHGGTRAYKCSDCQYTTKNKQKITWHIRIHTGEKPYKCHLCKYACADPSRLKYHMRIHKDERKYLCPDCGYKCKWVNQLKYHMTKHTGYKPYQCDECEYCTNRADALRIHKETRHRDTRSFICEQCGKAFKTRFLLKTHMKKHSEDKPYVCNVCFRGFRWAAGLRHHYLTHTKEHPFFCRYCSYKAKQKFQVIKHIRRHHPESATTNPQEGVGKDPSTPTVHLHDVQLDSAERAADDLPAQAVG